MASQAKQHKAIRKNRDLKKLQRRRKRVTKKLRKASKIKGYVAIE